MEGSKATSAWKLSVTGTETRVDEKSRKFTVMETCGNFTKLKKVYKVNVEFEGKEWFLFRRYSEFSAFYFKVLKKS